jgi:uncharacterized protein (TIGR03435 family)
MPIQQLVNMAEDSLKQPVVDETGLTGSYDFTFPWQGGRLDVTSAKKSSMRRD